MENLKIACIGAGKSGTNQMLWFEDRIPGSVVAFCDLNRELFDKIVDSYLKNKNSSISGHFNMDLPGIRKSIKDIPFYADAEEMLEKEDINTVIIATYCSAHAEMLEKCVEHNVNILVEKPLAITKEDIDKIWNLLKDYPKVTTVNFTMRGAPVTIAAQKYMRSKTIGNIVSVQYVNNVHYGDVYFRGWMRTQEKIGNLFLQKAVHDFDIINSIIGLKPLAIAAFGSQLVYGGNMPNDLTCDLCEKKWECQMSIYKLHFNEGKPLPAKDKRKCVYAKEINIKDNQVAIIQYEDGVTVSYCQTFNAPQEGACRGGIFVGTNGIMNLEYYGNFAEGSQGKMLKGNSRIDIIRHHEKPGSRILEIYDWSGHNHFDGTEYTLQAKLDLLQDRPTNIKNTIQEGYISTKMCLAAQKSLKEKRVVELTFDI